MNTKMLQNHMTAENLEQLRERPATFIHPTDSGELACGEIGSGKLPEVETVALMTEAFSALNDNFREVVVTAGSTHSPLDPVRFLTNPASGLTGKELALEFLKNGHKVTFVCGEHNTQIIENLVHHPNLTLLTGVTTQEIFEKINSLMDCDIYISAAAFSDIIFDQAKNKIKKETFPESIAIKQAPDILSEVLKKKSKHMKIVGFAAETNHDESMFTKKLDSKPVDLLIGNFVDNGSHSKVMKGFAQNENDYYFVTKNNVTKHAQITKSNLAKLIYQQVL
jgi:phosphopantothenoylcysteine decarboxylase/phosphopantothenate--cysteine ligase